MSKRTASAAATAYRGRIVGDGVDISCPHQHLTQDNARTCAKLALKYMRYRESLGMSLPAPETWLKTGDVLSSAHDVDSEKLLAQLEHREND